MQKRLMLLKFGNYFISSSHNNLLSTLYNFVQEVHEGVLVGNIIVKQETPCRVLLNGFNIWGESC